MLRSPAPLPHWWGWRRGVLLQFESSAMGSRVLLPGHCTHPVDEAPTGSLFLLVTGSAPSLCLEWVGSSNSGCVRKQRMQGSLNVTSQDAGP